MTRQAGRRERRTAGGIRQLAFGAAVNRYPPIALLSTDEVESIHLASLELLATTGMEVLHDESRRLLKSAGADIDESTLRVRFDPAMIEEKIVTPLRQAAHSADTRRRAETAATKVDFFTMVRGED